MRKYQDKMKVRLLAKLCCLALPLLLCNCSSPIQQRIIASSIAIGRDSLIGWIDLHSGHPEIIEDGYKLINDISQALQPVSNPSS